ncbi:hypothetical protein C0U44_32015, partial [Klebsiella pneumoniae]
APKDAKPIQKEIPGFGVVLNMPTYGGTLNEAITGLIAERAPKDAKPIQKEIPGFGVVLNMPTYGGTLNEAIT